MRPANDMPRAGGRPPRPHGAVPEVQRVQGPSEIPSAARRTGSFFRAFGAGRMLPGRLASAVRLAAARPLLAFAGCMTDGNVLLEVRDGIADLTLNRPDAANGINDGLARDLLAATIEIRLDDRVRVVLLSGNGPRFCGGGDVKAFAALGDDLSANIRALIPALHTAITSLVRGDAPVVAAVHGSAAGAGLGLVGASDLVVAGESTKFVMAYTGVGLTPDGSSSWFVPRLVGLRRALELTLTNRVLSAAEALDWGLITERRARRRREGGGHRARGTPRGRSSRCAGRGEASGAHQPRRDARDPSGERSGCDHRGGSELTSRRKASPRSSTSGRAPVR